MVVVVVVVVDTGSVSGECNQPGMVPSPATPADTTFALRRAYNCFWITL